jgi:uncharacterized membrane protein
MMRDPGVRLRALPRRLIERARKESAQLVSAHTDLVAVMACAVVAGPLLLVVPTTAVTAALKAIIAAALIVLLPGYALSFALFPWRVGAPERMALCFGFGLAGAVAVSLALNFAPWRLGPVQWTVGLTVTTVAAAAVGIARSAETPNFAFTRPSLALPDLHVAAFFGLALVFSVLALLLRLADGPQTQSGYTQLWALPAGVGPITSVGIGVASQEEEAQRYLLEVFLAGKLAQTRDFTLGPGQRWSDKVTVNASRRQLVEVLLYRIPGPVNPYRRVDVTVPSPSPQLSPAP